MSVLDFQHRLAERCDHEQLLHYAVHIADASNVFQTNIAGNRLLLLVIGRDGPIGAARRAPVPGDIGGVDCLSHVFDQCANADLIIDCQLLNK